jgi:hypothetical protein
MVFKPMVSLVVAEGHDGERKKRENLLQKKPGRGTDFTPHFLPAQAMKSTSIYRG